MKKKISGLLFGIIVCVAAFLLSINFVFSNVYADEHPARLVDDAGILTEDEADKITELLDEISNEKEFDIVIVTTYGLNNYVGEDNFASYYTEERDLADDFYDYKGYGFGKNNDGVLLLVNMENRQFWISTTGYGIKAINDETREEIQKKFTSYLSYGNYFKAFETFTEECGSAVSRTRFKNVLIHIGATLFIAIVAAFIVCGSMKAKLKSVRSQAAAGSYVVPDSMHLTNQSEMFLYSIVNRVAKPKDNGGGSSTHTSSSGTSHGGGGGSF